MPAASEPRQLILGWVSAGLDAKRLAASPSLLSLLSFSLPAFGVSAFVVAQASPREQAERAWPQVEEACVAREEFALAERARDEQPQVAQLRDDSPVELQVDDSSQAWAPAD
jgi:hypothetical protein